MRPSAVINGPLIFPLQDAQRGTREPGSAALFKIPRPRFGADDTPNVLPRAVAPTLDELGANGACGGAAGARVGGGAGVCRGADTGAATGLAGDIGAERGDSDGEYADPTDEPKGFGPDRLLDGLNSDEDPFV